MHEENCFLRISAVRVLHTYGACAGGDGSSVRGVKAALVEVGEAMFAGVGWTDLVGGGNLFHKTVFGWGGPRERV